MNEEYKPINNLWKDSEGYRYFGTLKLSSKIKYDGDDFIPLWEWINQLQKENKRLNGTIQTYDILLKANVEENKQLKDNWNKLRKWIVYNKHNENTEQHYLVVDYGTLLGKMQELERSNSNGNN
jgi:hypothetical protein